MAGGMIVDARTDEELIRDVGCFGHFWDPDESACNTECMIEERCIRFMARVTLPSVAAALKKPPAIATDEEYANHNLNVSSRALAWLRIVNSNPELGVPPPRSGDAHRASIRKDADGSPAESAHAATDEKSNPISPGKATPPSHAINGTKKRKKVRLILEQGQLEPPPDRDQRRVGKPRLPRVEATHTWGSHTHAKRWTRERSKHPLVSRIPIGWTLRRLWKDEVHETICREGFWEYRGRKLPTLYSVVEAITGVAAYPAQMKEGKRPEGRTREMTAWSARRFFDLDRVLLEHNLHPGLKSSMPNHRDERRVRPSSIR